MLKIRAAKQHKCVYLQMASRALEAFWDPANSSKPSRVPHLEEGVAAAYRSRLLAPQRKLKPSGLRKLKLDFVGVELSGGGSGVRAGSYPNRTAIRGLSVPWTVV